MAEPRFTNRDYLVNEQYKDSSKFNARVRVHALYSTSPQGWNQWLFEQMEMPDGARVLEVGCGPGNLWRQNANKLKSDWRVTLTDLSPGMVEENRGNMASLPPIFTYASVDVLALPFPDASFDCVLAMHMLYHVPDRPAGIREIWRVLKPGGRLYASTLGNDNMIELRDLLAPYSEQAARSLTFGAPGSGSPGAFNLEDGGSELERVFGKVERRLFEDSLSVTEAEPLVDYVLSMSSRPGFEERREGLTRIIQAEIDKGEGRMHIRKSGGMFVAEK